MQPGSQHPDNTGTAQGATRPKRQRARRGRKARTLRALKNVVETAQEIDRTARDRHRVRAAGEANVAEAKTTDLERLYVDLRAEKREVYSAGLVPEGRAFNRGEPGA